MHYAQFKHSSPSLVRGMIETFPFAAIVINGGDESPRVAHAPMTWRPGPNPCGAVEFHLASINPIASGMVEATPVTISISGPGAAISPSWYSASFPAPGSDRSSTAPTYNYLSLVLKGRLEFMNDEALQRQIRDLVEHSEPKNGWQVDELAPLLWQEWRTMIQGYRLEIEEFDLTAKISQGDSAGDRPGVVSGLIARGTLDDVMMARLVRDFDGTSTSLGRLLGELGTISTSQLQAQV